MDATEVMRRLSLIEKHQGDDELAHGIEDQMYQDLVTAIADGTCDDPRACARIALLSQQIHFARWCA